MDLEQNPALAGPPVVAVLIPTRDRPELLRSRSLPSVLCQRRAADHVIVIDDSSPRFRHETSEAVATLNKTGQIKLLRNTRARGAAGAWNTGLHYLAERFPGELVVVAFLDDDDEWTSEHLALAVAAIETHSLDVTATGMLRIERGDAPGRVQLAPAALDATAFLTGNPHVQGSNLVARLDVLLAVGGFDEALLSCTDRDLCLRFLDLEGVRYGATAPITVRHYAEPDRARLSTPGSHAKHAGLDGFWRKYRDRMSEAQRQAFRERSERLFHWQPPEEGTPDVWFVVGLTTDAGVPDRAVPLLEDLLQLGKQPGVAGLDVVVLENGPLPACGGLRDTIEGFRRRGLRIWLIQLERQQEAAARGAYGRSFVRGSGRACIAETRSMLQAHVYALARRRPGALAWILDDDKRIARWLAPGGAARLGASLLRLRSDGVAVALGVDEEAAPLPVLATLRGELHDLKSNLELLRSLQPDAEVPDRAAENDAVRRRSHSPYHDLAQGDGRHLESPLWWVPRTPGQTARQAFAAIAVRAAGLLNGQPIFRGLLPPENMDPAGVVAAAVPSTQRGGCTWILDLEALRGTPNVAASFDGDTCRRSDMIWALLLKHHLGHRVVQVPLGVTHDRSFSPVNDAFADLLRDARGHALHLALHDLLARHEGREEKSLCFTEDEERFFAARFVLHLHARIAAFERSAARVRALTRILSRILSCEEGPDAPWWMTDRSCDRPTSLLREAVRRTEALFTEDAVRAWLRAARETSATPALTFLRSLGGTLANWNAALEDRKTLWIALDEERIKNARAGTALFGGACKSLELLGAGQEGVVLTDGTHVYKWFDAWPLRQRPRQRAFAKQLVGRLTSAAALPRIDRIHEESGHIVMRYPFEPSDPYGGGHGPGLFRLLRECREHGLVCNNLHPSNLRVTGDRVLLIDAGADLVPFTEEGFTAMVRRAWLCFRFWFRSDLSALLTRSLREPELHELTGIDGLFTALNGPEPVVTYRRAITEAVVEAGARTVLDYGCGKGDLVLELAKAGLQTVGYDPDPAHAARWTGARAAGTGARFGGRELLAELHRTAQPFDAVVCSLVLCMLDDGPEYEAVLADLRRLVCDSGTVVVAICNPFVTYGGSTPFKQRPPHPGRSYDDTFAWVGSSGHTQSERRDVHRPLRVIERDLLRHGLLCRNRWQSASVDLERFEPASDFLVLVLQPAPGPLPVTLAIKTCAMDHRTIEEQIRHLVEQLEGPELFAERLLVVDSREHGFTRAHDDGNVGALEDAIERLVRYKLIDRVVRCPASDEARSSLSQRWFGLQTIATHARNGSPITATLAAFEEVRTPLLLQVDSDLMIHRPAPRDLALSRLVAALEEDPQAVTVSLSITASTPWGPAAEGEGGSFRVEVRGSLISLPRLNALRPLPNHLADGVLSEGWYRALDRVVHSGRARSLRIADPRLGFVHPPNQRKLVRDEWMAVLDRCASGQLPAGQIGEVDLCTPVEEWLGPPRPESVVVILQGRNVPLGRLRRALDSLSRQQGVEYGAILMDDGSAPPALEYLRAFPPERAERFSIVRTPQRRGGMANLVWAVRQICRDPDAVIVLLDADDALIGDRVLERVVDAHRAGADLTVGAMLRTDKEARYKVQFEQPRQNRGGCVWQHLRTFRKRLFDAIPDDALRLDGRYVEPAQDWAFMVAMVELAQQPVAFTELLYLYEPSGEGKHEQRARREEVIGRILAKPSLRSSARKAGVGGQHG